MHRLPVPLPIQDYARWNAPHQERDQWDHDLTHKWADPSAELESQKSQIS